jgi:hypothetical protein
MRIRYCGATPTAGGCGHDVRCRRLQGRCGVATYARRAVSARSRVSGPVDCPHPSPLLSGWLEYCVVRTPCALGRPASRGTCRRAMAAGVNRDLATVWARNWRRKSTTADSGRATVSVVECGSPPADRCGSPQSTTHFQRTSARVSRADVFSARFFRRPGFCAGRGSAQAGVLRRPGFSSPQSSTRPPIRQYWLFSRLMNP